MDSIKEFLREHVAPPLKALHEPLDRWLVTLPAWVPIACAVGLFALAAIGCLFLKKDYVFQGEEDRRPWRDLRLWAIASLIPYVLIYLFAFR